MKKYVLSFTRNLFVSYLITAIALFILAFILYKFKLQETQVKIGVYAIYIFSCFIGGFLTGHSFEAKRYLGGCLFGLLFFLILLIISIITAQAFTTNIPGILAVFAFCVVGGAIGAMVS